MLICWDGFILWGPWTAQSHVATVAKKNKTSWETRVKAKLSSDTTTDLRFSPGSIKTECDGPPSLVFTSCWWGRIWSRSVRPRSNRGLWPGSTQRSRSRITRTSAGPAGPHPAHWTHTAVAVEEGRKRKRKSFITFYRSSYLIHMNMNNPTVDNFFHEYKN